MKRVFSLRVVVTLLISVVLAVLIAVTLSLGNTSFLQRATGTLLQPVRTGVAAITRHAERYYNYLYQYDALAAENRVLHEQLAQLEQENREAAEYRRENERLRALLNLQEEFSDQTLVSAYVTGWNNSNWRSDFTIGKGTSSGLQTGMAAITEYGQMVGLITDIGLNWATVTTVLDTNLRFSAQIAGSGYTGVAQGALQTGDAGNLRLDYLSADALLKCGDLVVTTGSSQYPKGIPLGYIASFGLSEGGTDRYALLTSCAKLENLEQVFIITDYVTR